MAIIKPLPPLATEILRKAGFRTDTAYMEVPRCDGCKWWAPFEAGLQPAGIFPDLTPQIRALGVNLERLGTCRLFECHEYEQVHAPLCKIDVMRTQSGEASIATQADFGCVQWEAKP